MAKSTFSGPVRSLAGFISAGSTSFVSLTADTSLTVAAHAETAATDMDILTDGTDKFVGGLYTGVTNATGKTFISGASNDVITMNGSTKGGLAGSIVKVTAMASAKYAVEGLDMFKKTQDYAQGKKTKGYMGGGEVMGYEYGGTVKKPKKKYGG
eukprot:gene3662-2709_t